MDDNAKLVALQLGNTYGLVFLIATAVLYTTSEIKVVRNYLVACWLADISHVYVCYHVLGWARFVDIATWNSMTWGNVGATVSFLSRHIKCDNLYREQSNPDAESRVCFA